MEEPNYRSRVAGPLPTTAFYDIYRATTIEKQRYLAATPRIIQVLPRVARPTCDSWYYQLMI